MRAARALRTLRTRARSAAARTHVVCASALNATALSRRRSRQSAGRTQRAAWWRPCWSPRHAPAAMAADARDTRSAARLVCRRRRARKWPCSLPQCGGAGAPPACRRTAAALWNTPRVALHARREVLLPYLRHIQQHGRPRCPARHARHGGCTQHRRSRPRATPHAAAANTLWRLRPAGAIRRARGAQARRSAWRARASQPPLPWCSPAPRARV